MRWLGTVLYLEYTHRMWERNFWMLGSELTLDKAIEIARSHELAQAQMKNIILCGSTSTSCEQALHTVRQTSKHTSGAQTVRFRTERQNSKTEGQRLNAPLHVDIVNTKCMTTQVLPNSPS
jgi:hypothetical protein